MVLKPLGMCVLLLLVESGGSLASPTPENMYSRTIRTMMCCACVATSSEGSSTWSAYLNCVYNFILKV